MLSSNCVSALTDFLDDNSQLCFFHFSDPFSRLLVCFCLIFFYNVEVVVLHDRM